MSQPKPRFLSPAEASRRFGVTPKALRVYERHGLIEPFRTGSGYRAYGPEQLARLHQILVLKRLGFPLARMGALLGGRLASLDAVLDLQQTALVKRKVELERALRTVDAARLRLARGDSLSLDDLATLTKDTIMSERMNDEEFKAAFGPLWAKHFTPDDMATMAFNKERLGAQHMYASFPPQAYKLARCCEEAYATGDPESAEAIEAARKVHAWVNQLTDGDEARNARVVQVWREALADPQIAPRMPLTIEVFEFTMEAMRRAGIGKLN